MILLSNKDPFGLGMWQDFLNQLAFLKEHSLTSEDVEKVLKDKKVKQEQPIKAKQCPECKEPMQLLSVNHDLATQTNDDSKSMWLCRACHYERFSTNSIEEELKWPEQE